MYDLWKNWASRRHKQLVLSSRWKTGTCWLMQDWIKHKVFSAAEVQILCWVYITWGADDLYWDSSCECQHHQVAAELPPSLKLVWNSSELLCSVNYAHKCPGVQLGRLAGAGLMDLRVWELFQAQLKWHSNLRVHFLIQTTRNCGLFTYKLLLDA